MSFLSMKGRGTDGRLDKVIEKLAKVHGDSQEHVSSLSEVDLLQQESIDQLQRDVMQLEEAIDFTNNRTTDVIRRTAIAEDDIKGLKSRPTPIIPDIRSLRADVSRVRVTQDEMISANHGEMNSLWGSYRDLKSDILDLSAEIKAIPKPASLWPLYTLLIITALAGLLQYVG